MSLSAEEQMAFRDHLSVCPSCSALHAMISDWKADKPEDNPYLAQKVIDKITAKDTGYAKTAKIAIRWAFFVAIFLGISLGTLVQITLKSSVPDLQMAENEYQENIDNYSTEIHYSELKTDETQMLLTDAR